MYLVKETSYNKKEEHSFTECLASMFVVRHQASNVPKETAISLETGLVSICFIIQTTSNSIMTKRSITQMCLNTFNMKF